MSEKVLCPYCGAEMRLLPFNACGGWDVDFKQWIDKKSVSYQCSICFAKSPTAWASTTNEAKERALSAAMQRYVTPNRVLTWQEMLEHPNDMPIITEVKGGRLELLYNDRPANPIRFEAAKKNYNKTARAWLRIPTDEERQSMAWEGSE